MKNQTAEIRQRWNEYWDGLATRERRLLLLAGIAIVLWLVAYGVVKPLQDAEEQAANRLNSSRATLVQMQEMAAEIQVLRASGAGSVQADFSQPLDVQVNRSARKAGIKVTGLNQQQSSLLVKLDDVSFQKLIGWLQQLEQQGIVIENIEMKRGEASGLVSVQSLRVSRQEV
ncbi:hypothetical protein EOPP23_04410 [Endozoicomonas sp. OPT23]|uniref:type II secretion system protein GspM n=1 Tax=Endozoicomonas sp. OPT23 TaxID=2072845 RepID=UPI00129BD3C0|nr:type II secretion system protein M [Endozoicomonas sp. OPT23]MRI32235.1 hypothetical protein [Endozoicomonas sp. OPT23]